MTFYYILNIGIKSLRDNAYNFCQWDTFSSLEMAKREAKINRFKVYEILEVKTVERVTP